MSRSDSKGHRKASVSSVTMEILKQRQCHGKTCDSNLQEQLLSSTSTNSEHSSALQLNLIQFADTVTH